MSESKTGDSTLKHWITAARPHTLPAAASPVLVGIGLAVHKGVFAPFPALGALIGALLIQIGTNFANDYFDAHKGVDRERKDGFTRVTESGLIPPRQVIVATLLTFGLAFLCGVYLVFIAGLPILIVGVLGILAGLTYSGGPLPFGSIGLGDLMVFLFFGVVAVTGTYFVQSAYQYNPAFLAPLTSKLLPPEAFIASLPAAALSTNILVINNLRDLETDRKAGKKTLAVLIGRTGSKLEFVLLLLLAYGAPVWLYVSYDFPLAILLPLVSTPSAVILTWRLWNRTSGKEMNQTLTITGKLLLVHSILFAAGFYMS